METDLPSDCDLIFLDSLLSPTAEVWKQGNLLHCFKMVLFIPQKHDICCRYRKLCLKPDARDLWASPGIDPGTPFVQFIYASFESTDMH